MGGAGTFKSCFWVSTEGIAAVSSSSELIFSARMCLHGPTRDLLSFIAAGDSLPLVNVGDVSSSVLNSRSLSGVCVRA